MKNNIEKSSAEKNNARILPVSECGFINASMANIVIGMQSSTASACMEVGNETITLCNNNNFRLGSIAYLDITRKEGAKWQDGIILEK